MMNRMLLRLFAVPMLLAGGSIVALWFFGWFIPGQFHDKPLLATLAEQSAQAAPWVAGALWLASVAIAAAQGHNLWRWRRDEAPSCHQCGGLMSSLRDGRYGLYSRCFACGKAEKA